MRDLIKTSAGAATDTKLNSDLEKELIRQSALSLKPDGREVEFINNVINDSDPGNFILYSLRLSVTNNRLLGWETESQTYPEVELKDVIIFPWDWTRTHRTYRGPIHVHLARKAMYSAHKHELHKRKFPFHLLKRPS